MRNTPSSPPARRPTKWIQTPLVGLLVGLLVVGCDRGTGTAEDACIRGFDDWAPAAGPVASISLDRSESLPPAALTSPISATAGPGDPSPVAFFRPGGLLRLENGTLAVLDQGTQEVHFLDPSGVRTATMGGRGDGPGSFRFASRMVALGPDSVGVIDGTAGRLTVFGPGGELVRTAPLAPQVESGQPAMARITLLGTRSGDRWLGRHSIEVTPEPLSPTRDSMAVVMVDAQGQVERTLGRYPDGDRWALGGSSTEVGGVQLYGADRLIGSRPTLVTPLPGGVAIARGDRFGVVVLDDDGAVRLRIALDAPCRPVTAEVAERAAAASAAAIRLSDPAAGAGASRPIDAAMAAEVEAFYLAAPRVPHLPPLDQMLGGTDGSLWIGAHVAAWEDAEQRIWVGIGPDGREIGRMMAPLTFRPLLASSSGLEGVLPDELGEETLVHLRIRTP